MNGPVSDDLNSILPGVTEAYAALLSKDGRGLYTSRGRFFNRTIFGRDASMSAKFIADFDHKVAVEVIMTLIAFQGTRHDQVTQEEPGRIHHEWRDFHLWKGSLFEHIPFWLLHRKWGIRNRRVLTYFSLDTTASFIRLVHKYATHIDEAILDRQTRNNQGEMTTVRAALEAAADWIMEMTDDDGFVSERRANKWSLPIQTFQDSQYSRSDGSLIDIGDRIVYIEVQAFAADALYDLAHLLPEHEKATWWRETGLRIHRSLLTKFRRDDDYFASAIDSRGRIDVPNVSAGWILNTFVWHELSAEERETYIGPLVERLFSDEFLTPVGLRTRSLSQPNPIKGVLDYHGSETVWPMFSFMVVEGLRRHRLYELADQLENRIINGLNAIGGFPEYHIVLRDGKVVGPSGKWGLPTLNVQMKQERNIAFSIVPGLVMARRALSDQSQLEQKPWQEQLERRVLATIEHVERAQPDDAATAIGGISRYRQRRWIAGFRIVHYFWRQRRMISR